MRARIASNSFRISSLVAAAALAAIGVTLPLLSPDEPITVSGAVLESCATACAQASPRAAQSHKARIPKAQMILAISSRLFCPIGNQSLSDNFRSIQTELAADDRANL
jgi:hypothetical protein